MTNSAQYIPRYRAIYHLFENELDKHLNVCLIHFQINDIYLYMYVKLVNQSSILIHLVQYIYTSIWLHNELIIFALGTVFPSRLVWNWAMGDHDCLSRVSAGGSPRPGLRPLVPANNPRGLGPRGKSFYWSESSATTYQKGLQTFFSLARHLE